MINQTSTTSYPIELSDILRPALTKNEQLHSLIDAVKMQDKLAEHLLKEAEDLKFRYDNALAEAGKLREVLLINHNIIINK